MNIIEENLDLLKSDTDLIAHQVNCLGVMGAGVAAQIKCKYPEVYKEYKETCEDFKHDTYYLFGKCLISGKVANLFGEDKPSSHYRDTNYEAIYQALESLREQMIELGKTSVSFPYKMSCGLAKGDWDIIFTMIKSVFKSTDFTIKICKI